MSLGGIDVRVDGLVRSLENRDDCSASSFGTRMSFSPCSTSSGAVVLRRNLIGEAFS